MNKEKEREATNKFLDEIINVNKFLIRLLSRERFRPVEFIYDIYRCPDCLKLLEDKEKKFNYCPHCGQHIYYE